MIIVGGEVCTGDAAGVGAPMNVVGDRAASGRRADGGTAGIEGVGCTAVCGRVVGGGDGGAGGMVAGAVRDRPVTGSMGMSIIVSPGWHLWVDSCGAEYG